MSRPRDPGWHGLAFVLAVLAVAVACGLAVLGVEPDQWRATAFAAGVTGAGAVAAWLVARWGRSRSPALAVAAGLGVTAVRLGPPLAALAWLVTRRGPLWEAGAAGLLVAFHLAVVAADVVVCAACSRAAGRRKYPQKTGPGGAN